MAAQRTRAEILTENLANAETTRTPGGGPYRRKDVVFQAQQVSSPFSSALSAAMGAEPAGVSVAEIVTDQSAPDQRYLPDHPDAGPDGYVAFPKINPAEEMVNLMSASRSYQANVAGMSAVKDMIVHSIDLLR
jgi:flagellar basal-body rod protein FlgC